MFGVLFRNQHSNFSISINPSKTTLCNLGFFQSLHFSAIPSCPTEDYLLNTCGLTSTKASQIAKNFQLKSAENPNLVLNLFISFGITDTHIQEIISKLPKILSCRPETNLKPKFEFLRSLGVSGPQIAEILTRDKEIIGRSLENRIIPACNLLRRYFTCHESFISALMRSGKFCNHHTESNIALLCEYGVPESNIIHILRDYPRAFARKHDEFKKIVQEVKNMGLDPSTLSFCFAVSTMGGMNDSAWKRRWDVYQKLGFSDEEILSMFKKEPLCLMSSDEKINRTVEIMTNQLQWEISDISSRPDVLLMSLEKKIIPSWRVKNWNSKKKIIPIGS